MKINDLAKIVLLSLGLNSCIEPFPYSYTEPLPILAATKMEPGRATIQTSDLGRIKGGDFSNSFLVLSFPTQNFPELKNLSGLYNLGEFNFYYDDINKNNWLDKCEELRGVRFSLNNRAYNIQLNCSHLKTIQTNSPFNYNIQIRR